MKKKKKKAFGYFSTLSPGNVEQDIETFNKGFGDTITDGAMCEDWYDLTDEERNELEAEIHKYNPNYRISHKNEDYEMTLKEKLNQLEHKALDNGKYLDIVNLYEAVGEMTMQDKEELKRVINTNDPDIVAAYLDGKYQDKDKNGLKEEITNSVTDDLEKTVIKMLIFLSERYSIPSDLIYDDWDEWIDDMYITATEGDISESAEILLDEYRRMYDSYRQQIKYGDEDPELVDFTVLYNELKNANVRFIDMWNAEHAEEDE